MYHESKIAILPKPVTPQHTAGFALIFVLVFGLGWYFYSLMVQSQKLEADIVVKSAAVTRWTEDKTRMNTYLERYGASIEEFKQILFKEKDVPLFIRGISDISQKNNVSVLSIKNLAEKKITIAAPGPDNKSLSALLPVKDGAFTIAVTPFQVDVEGNLENVLLVLAALENTRQLLTISNFSFTLKSYPIIRASFDINLYGFGEKDAEK